MTVEVCVGSACHLKGAYSVINEFIKIIKEKKLEDTIELKAAFCLGNCTSGVSVRIDEGEVLSCGIGDVQEFFVTNILGGM